MINKLLQTSRYLVLFLCAYLCSCGGGGGSQGDSIDTNKAPVAKDDILLVYSGTSVPIDVRNNDADLDGDQLTISTFSSPLNGAVSRLSNGKFIYTANQGFTGNDSFTYTVSDGKNGISTATVGVIIPNENVLAAGFYHSIAVKNDGTVWVWGNNSAGQLGDGSTTDSNHPIKAPNISGAIAVTAGSGTGGNYFSLALKEDGSVLAWGSNHAGQLGDGTIINSSLPVLVSGLPTSIKVSAGSAHVVALAKDGTVWAWGHNGYGQLGDGTRTNSNVPVKVQGLDNVVDVIAGGTRNLALRSDGTVMEWGDESGGNSRPAPPSEVIGLSRIVGITAGSVHRLALNSDGTVWAWGSGYAGTLGDGTGLDSNSPVKVADLSNVIALNAGVGVHNFAIKTDNSIWGWGKNDMGQLGVGNFQNATRPISLTNVGTIKAITIGEFHTLSRKTDGTVWSWGLNSYGELGNGTRIDSNTPVQILGFNLNTI